MNGIDILIAQTRADPPPPASAVPNWRRKGKLKKEIKYSKFSILYSKSVTICQEGVLIESSCDSFFRLHSQKGV